MRIYSIFFSELFQLAWCHGTALRPASRQLVWAYSGIVSTTMDAMDYADEKIPEGYNSNTNKQGRTCQRCGRKDVHRYVIQKGKRIAGAYRYDDLPLCGMGYTTQKPRKGAELDKDLELIYEDPRHAILDSIEFNHPSTGIPKFNLVNYPWRIRPGWNEFRYYVLAGHPTRNGGYIHHYLTKKKENGNFHADLNQRITWGDLEDEPFCTYKPTYKDDWEGDGVEYKYFCEVPSSYDGQHLIFTIWQPDYAPGKNFGPAWYSCADVNILNSTIYGPSHLDSKSVLKMPSLKREDEVIPGNYYAREALSENPNAVISAYIDADFITFGIIGFLLSIFIKLLIMPADGKGMKKAVTMY